MPRQKASSNRSGRLPKTGHGSDASRSATAPEAPTPPGPPNGEAPLAVRQQPTESLLAFHTPEGWGKATIAAGITAERIAAIIGEIAKESRNDNARLAAAKYLIERSEQILRTANIMRTIRGRQTLELPEQLVEGRVVKGTEVLETEEHQLVQDSVARTEQRLREATAGTVLPGAEDDDLTEEDDL